MKTMELWECPSDYAGFSPDGDYVLYAKTRDSVLLTETNYAGIAKDMNAAPFESDSILQDTPEGFESRPTVYTWSASHWACGWIEYMMVRGDAPDEVIEKGNEITTALDGYPVYDEDAYSDAEQSAMEEYWNGMSLKEKIETCVRNKVSIFAARRYCGYSDENSSVEEYIRECVNE